MKTYHTRKTIALLFILGVLCAMLTTAQQIKHLNNKNGLTTGNVVVFEKDSLGYLWIGTNQGLSRYSGVEFKNYELEKVTSKKGNSVAEILNVKGELYVICSNGTLLKYKYDADRFVKIFSEENKAFNALTSINGSKLLIAVQAGFILYDTQSKKHKNIPYPEIEVNRKLFYKNELIYCGTSRGIYVFNYDKNKDTILFKNRFLAQEDVIDLAFDPKNRIWVGTETGGLHIITDSKTERVNIGQVLNKTYAIREIAFDKNNNALIAIDRLGLFVLNSKFEIIKSFSHDVNDDNSINQNSIYEIYVDETNAYWLGIREGGINIITEKDNVFENILHVKNESNSISNNKVRSIYESSNGSIWFGTENGISKYAANKQWTNFNKNPQLFNTAILTITEYNGDIVLGTYGEGLLKLDEKTENLSSLSLEPAQPLKFVFHSSFFDENLWIGGSDGPLTHYLNNKLINKYAVGTAKVVTSGYDGINYVGSTRGLFEINKRNGSVRKIKENPKYPFNEINDLYFDQLNNCIWVAATNGVFKYNPSNDESTLLNENASADMGTVFSIEKDNRQNLFFGTITGLWKYNIKTQVLRKYDQQDGLFIDEFGPGASAQLRDGRLAFGGPNGAVIFDPILLTADETIGDVYLSNFQINGKNPDSLQFPKSINYQKEVVLNYDQNTISFNLETLKFHGSKRNIFKVKLIGYDADYKVIATNKKITYSNIKPGSYTLHVQAFNADGVQGSSDYSLKIVVKNPFWKTGWAIAFYLCIMSIIVYLVLRISKANLRKLEDENRIKFFVEVAHDIRTPVSLIQLLVTQLANQQNVEKSIELIQRNTQNLNEYVTQLLDFQKINRNQLKLAVSNIDLKDCIAKIIEDFTPILQEKSIDITLDMKHLSVWLDEPKMKRIFYNLISNAIKYSHEGGEITIRAFVDDKLKIEFIDNGIGVPAKQQDLIFQRFTRGTNVSNKGIPGTGIGLLLSKKIIELHGGQILLESKENVGSKFTVVLPTGTDHYAKDEVIIPHHTHAGEKKINDFINDNKLVLLVEDNDELRTAIKTELEVEYSIIEAVNGKEGLLIALSKNPDLIITDVMMPEMDGKELCNLLKTNFKTSHIPVIMLSALVDVDDKLQGLENGADAYVEKPFNVEILKVTMNNLLKSRENISHLLQDKQVKKQLTPDESFLSDIIDTIKSNLTEKDFSIDTLCDIMGLSRSNLFRKLKGLIQMSPSDLIIKIKLSHAEELMRSKSHHRVSDIAYDSGFQDPKYFSTIFKKHYNKTPKEFMDSL